MSSCFETIIRYMTQYFRARASGGWMRRDGRQQQTHNRLMSKLLGYSLEFVNKSFDRMMLCDCFSVVGCQRSCGWWNRRTATNSFWPEERYMNRTINRTDRLKGPIMSLPTETGLFDLCFHYPRRSRLLIMTAWPKKLHFLLIAIWIGKSFWWAEAAIEFQTPLESASGSTTHDGLQVFRYFGERGGDNW